MILLLLERLVLITNNTLSKYILRVYFQKTVFMSFKNSPLMYINILTSTQCLFHFERVPANKRQRLLVTCTKICVSAEIAPPSHTPGYRHFKSDKPAGERQVPNTAKDNLPMWPEDRNRKNAKPQVIPNLHFSLWFVSISLST